MTMMIDTISAPNKPREYQERIEISLYANCGAAVAQEVLHGGLRAPNVTQETGPFQGPPMP